MTSHFKTHKNNGVFDTNTSFYGFLLSKELKRIKVMFKNMFAAIFVIVMTNANNLKISTNCLIYNHNMYNQKEDEFGHSN